MAISEMAGEMYARQIMLKEVGEEGQQKLSASSVLVVGCGGLGSPALYYLAAMGVGHIGLVDCDVISASNLNRQVLYTAADIGKPKAETAAARIRALNPELKTTVYGHFFDREAAAELIPAYDMAVDCLDNFAARFVLNDACVAAGKPFVHAGVERFFGQLLTVTPGRGPCLRCLFPHGETKPPGGPIGVLGATPGVLGAMQATEVIKYLLGLPVNNKGFLLYDGLNMSCGEVALTPAPECICQKKHRP